MRMLPDTKDEKFRYADPREDISKPILTKSNTDDATSILAFIWEKMQQLVGMDVIWAETIEFGDVRELEKNAMETHRILAKRTDLAGHISWG